MPSFFSKVFGRKKDEKEVQSPTTPTTEKRLSAPPLLEGKYEAISPSNASPSTNHFPDNTRLTATSSKDSPLALFRPRSRNVEHTRKSNVSASPAPHLTLNLPEEQAKSNRALDVVFESVPEEAAAKDVGERRLSPAETLRLVQACSKAIVEHGGLETLGLMHPHWYAASNEVQKRLVSLFLLSLASKSPASSPQSAAAMFDSELKYTRSPHDVAAILRWGLRHLKLEGTSFGKGASEWEWYATFASSERQADFPPTAFSKTLVPLLPSSHVQLLTTTLDIIESLAAHAELNGSSGSKLSKLFGLWLVSAQPPNKEEDWADFYKRWETAGRILEHLFLAHVREESSLLKMPLRLSELVKQYPYGTVPSAETNEDLPFLVQPRFSTRRYDALFVRLGTELRAIDSPRPPRQHPLHLLSQAIKAKTSEKAVLADDVVTIWEDIRKQALTGEKAADGSPVLSQILDDETIRILSLVPGWEANSTTPTQPTETSPPIAPIIRAPTHRVRRSSSLGIANKPSANGNGHDAGAPPTDWADFSKLGFGESSLGQNLNLSLNDSDVEVTAPKAETLSPSKRRRASSPRRGRKSLDKERDHTGAGNTKELPVLLTQVGTVTIDEAFFDFWSDALLDPISADWPTFAVYQLKRSAWKYTILIVEQMFTRPTPPPLPPLPQFENTGRRASSPRPSLTPSGRGRRSFNFSPTVKRFSFFSNHNTSATDVNPKAPAQKTKGVLTTSTMSPKIGELGQILSEEAEPGPGSVKAADVPKESISQGLGISVAESAEENTKKQAKEGISQPIEAASVAVLDPAVPVEVEEKKSEPITVSEDKEKEDLPPVPLVGAEATASTNDIPPAAVEPVKTEEEAPVRPSIFSDNAALSTADVLADSNHEKQLPPAPEVVVLTGSTPGPQVSLDASEPVALAQASKESTEQMTPEPIVVEAPTPPTKDGTIADATEVKPADSSSSEPEKETSEERSLPAVETEPVVANIRDPHADEPLGDEPVASDTPTALEDAVPENVGVPVNVDVQDTVPVEGSHQHDNLQETLTSESKVPTEAHIVAPSSSEVSPPQPSQEQPPSDLLEASSVSHDTPEEPQSEAVANGGSTPQHPEPEPHKDDSTVENTSS
ncbi:hypothetical protein BDY19DRAFT_1078982 [Irpex rosettiformis]|uniref:Uncharacterized protein n=1 Tax=Irpex rosettiformis TaxID=378272 RepID=A0ACB8TNN2_9APHY|nr:hypothetical protein BDY19DRAFT_1078982 [Irpex rosettiformis]